MAALRVSPRILGLVVVGLAGCAQILGVDEEAHLRSTTSSGGSSSTSSTSSATSTGESTSTGSTCGDCTPADDCTEGACDAGMCTVAPKEPGSPCSGGVCSSEAKCVECLTSRECTNGAQVCLPDHQCAPVSCTNGLKDGDETALDCGGSCSRCANGLGCGANDDCVSGTCSALLCAPCAADGDCNPGRYCDVPSGLCELKHFDGAGCVTANECKSSRCVPGTGGVKVCCDDDCAGGCESCLAAETNAPQGTCASVRPGLDPKDACPTLTCRTGSCDGAGACASMPTGSPCSGGSCVGAAYDPPDTCDAAAQCAPTPAMSCAGNTICTAGACLSSCAAHADCAVGHYCAAPACLAKKPNNAPCADSVECLSNNCGSNHKCKN